MKGHTMPRLFSIALSLCLLLIALPGNAATKDMTKTTAHDAAHDTAHDMAYIEITAPYSYATSASQKNGAAFFTVTNTSDKDLTITGATAENDIADHAELHTHIMDGDKMMMRRVDGYDIPAGKSITLKPMGHHIMLMDLKTPLQTGDHLALTLQFSNGDTKPVDIPVIAPGTKPDSSPATTQPSDDNHHDNQDHSHH